MLVISCIGLFVGLVSYTIYWLVKKLKHENAFTGRLSNNSSGLLTEYTTMDDNGRGSFNQKEIKEDSVKSTKELM